VSARNTQRQVVTSSTDLQAGDTARFESPTVTVSGPVLAVDMEEDAAKIHAFGIDVWIELRHFTVGARDVEVDDQTETYTVAQIREAFAKHAGPDDWNVPNFYEDGLIDALRGKYDEPTTAQGASA
jgi:hypothetical protein